MNAESVIELLRAHRLSATNEDALQRGVALALDSATSDYVREARLSPTDRIDFLVGTCGIECKISGATHRVLRQMLRYAQHSSVTELILVTTRSVHLIGATATLNQKPFLVHVVSPFQ